LRVKRIYQKDGQIKRDEMGGACGTYWDRRKARTIFRKDLMERNRLADPGEFGG
jgi:hypothetical protein